MYQFGVGACNNSNNSCYSLNVYNGSTVVYKKYLINFAAVYTLKYLKYDKNRIFIQSFYRI